MFHDRIDAGIQLAEKLRKYQGQPGVVLAVPRGGVPVAYAVARELGLPLDIILTKKIGHPLHKEYAIGAVSLTDEFIISHEGVSDEYINEEIAAIRIRLRDMYRRFMVDQPPEDVKGKTVIIIDDGIATGNTLMVTVKMLEKKHPAKIVVAAPVASIAAVHKLSQHVDDVVAVLVPSVFHGVGAFYEDFEQVTNAEVVYYLEKFRKGMRQTG